MLATFVHDVFAIVKFLFGLGALFGLLAIGGLCVWFLGRMLLKRALRGQSGQRYPALRKLFFES